MSRARLIDLTRSLRRAGRIPTGVDRVELAYLDHLLTDDVPVFGLVRTPFGYLVLDRDGLKSVQARLQDQTPWGPPGLLSRLPRTRSAAVAGAETDMRRFAAARLRRGALGRGLRRRMPDGFDYYNVGHSNLTTRVFDAVCGAGGATHVMVHDVIPLEYPQFQRPGTVASFEGKMRRVAQHADRVIYTAQDTRMRIEKQFVAMGRVPGGVVAHLGVTPPVPAVDEVPHGVVPDGPYFVTVGTIEPRKNHMFLLDLWDRLQADMGDRAPHLLICGSRGWNNADVFDRLDQQGASARVSEVPGLTDGALAALVQNSAGSLFPSHAEGFGLPPVEALHLGARVLCNDLLVLREVLGESAVYAPVSDTDLWQNTLRDWAENPARLAGERDFTGRSWADHFKIVLTLN